MSDIDMSKLRQTILDDGDKDYTGLYEIIWSLNTHYPDVERVAKVAAARKITLDLLREGEISFYTTRWASNHYDPVPAAEAFRLAASPEAWDDPSDDPYVCYATP
jgi:hypothetical protein